MSEKINIVNEILQSSQTRLIRFVDERNEATLVTKDQFNVDFDKNKWQRKTDPILESEIENIWSEKLKTSRVYDASKFRLGGCSMNSNQQFIMHLGITSYKSIIGTTQNKNLKTWLSKGVEKFDNSRAYLSDGLGIR